jgi:hypothetical protein
MYSREPNWLLPEDLIRKYEGVCQLNHITERRLTRLFDAFLLRGRCNRKSSRIEILEESFEELLDHVRYTLQKQLSKLDKRLPVKIPEYCKHKYRIYYDSSFNLYTPSEILKTYSEFLQYERYFSPEFIGELVHMGLITGKYSPGENCYYVLLSSFVDIIKLREYCVDGYKLLPPPQDRTSD